MAHPRASHAALWPSRRALAASDSASMRPALASCGGPSEPSLLFHDLQLEFGPSYRWSNRKGVKKRSRKIWGSPASSQALASYARRKMSAFFERENSRKLSKTLDPERLQVRSRDAAVEKSCCRALYRGNTSDTPCLAPIAEPYSSTALYSVLY